ncbi:MAG: uracil-DNA glycosylase family protein [Planctomycetia bacterium]
MHHDPEIGADDPLAEARLLAAALEAHARRAAQRGVAWCAVETPAPTATAWRPAEAPAAASANPSGARSSLVAPAADAATSAPESRAPALGTTAAATRALPGMLAPACATLEDLRLAVAACTACDLCRTRTQTVVSDGSGARRVLFVGEAPGADEDRTGVPFVGAAGQLLTDIIEKGMRLRRDEVWIANLLKCRPPGNRDPAPQETELCAPWLERQIELMQPRIIIALGRHAAGYLLGSNGSLASLRGRVHERRGIPVVATYHPAYLLRTPADKKECWQDIQLAMRTAGLLLPS